MAHIEDRREQGRGWRVRYRAPDGRERSRSFRRKADAERFAVSVESSMLRGEWIDPRLGKTTFGEWAARWMPTTAALKPKTRAGYESLLRTYLIPRFGHAPLARIEPVQVHEWIADLVASGLSPSRIRQCYFLLSNILKAALESGYIARTPCVGVKLPRVTGAEMRFLTADEVARLADAITRPYAPLVYLLAYGGTRWGEAVALRRGRCELLRSRIQVRESLADVDGHLHFGATKTYETRFVSLPRFLVEMLARHLAENVTAEAVSLVFAAPGGGPLRHANFRGRVWRPALRTAGLPEGLRIHDLRHTCAALLISRGAHPKAIQQHLGHSSITVTMDRYGHLFPDDMSHLAEDLDGLHRRSLAAPARPEHGFRAQEPGLGGT